MKNKVVLITGATSGVGKATAVELAKMGARVVFNTRDETRGKLALADIKKASGSKKIDVIYCELGSFDSIRKCCREYQNKYDRLDVLINNAGLWDFTRRESNDGIERTFAVNYLAPFLMTNLLLDQIKESAPSRIINVTSGLHRGPIDLEDLELKKGFKGIKAYGRSKLAIILFTKMLAEKLKGTGVTVNCYTPGMTRTNLARDSGAIQRGFFKLITKSPIKGARTGIYLASSTAVDNVTGEYFSKMQIKRPAEESYDMEMAQKLWDIGEKYVGFK